MSLTVVDLSKGMYDKEKWTGFVDRAMMKHKLNQPLKPVKKTLDARSIQVIRVPATMVRSIGWNIKNIS
jgi:hypothetical protein